MTTLSVKLAQVWWMQKQKRNWKRGRKTQITSKSHWSGSLVKNNFLTEHFEQNQTALSEQQFVRREILIIRYWKLSFETFPMTNCKWWTIYDCEYGSTSSQCAKLMKTHSDPYSTQFELKLYVSTSMIIPFLWWTIE